MTAASSLDVAPIRAAILDWYGRGHRDLPWRGTRDPYAVLVSEVMLQQTQASRVAVRYPRFMARFPSVRGTRIGPGGGRPRRMVGAWLQPQGPVAASGGDRRCGSRLADRFGGPTPAPRRWPVHRSRHRITRVRMAGRRRGHQRTALVGPPL